jgi:hypothetical protein
MTKNDIAKLCFKLLAVYFVMQLFYQTENIGKYLLYDNEMPEHIRVNYIIEFLPSILFFITGFILWFISPNLANSVFKSETDEDIQVSIENFHTVAFSVTGLFLFASSFSEIVNLFVFNIHLTTPAEKYPITHLVIIAALKILLGVWLILGSRGIVNAIRALRRA